MLTPTSGDADDLLISGPDRGLVPGGLCLPDPADLARLRASAAAGVPLDLTGWSALPSSAVEIVDLALVPRRPDPAALAAWRGALRETGSAAGRGHAADPLMDPAPLRSLAPILSSAALAADAVEVARLAHRLVGAGPGATPTGDDVIVGVLAALRSCAGVPAVDADRALAVLADVVLPLVATTTRPSRHDLHAALGGLFAERVHTLAASASDAALVPAAVRAAQAFGATSGIDLAHGLVAGLSAVLDRAAATPTIPFDPAPSPASPEYRRSA